jgi:hypothetical protein
VPVRQRIVRAMPTVYKYLLREHAESLVLRGEVQLGTLYKFRDAEEYRAGRLDKDEARTYEYDNPIAASGADLSDFAKRSAPSSAPGVMYVQCVFEEGQDATDRWLYCTSTRLSSRLLPVFESDSCVMIRDGAAFYKALFTALAEEGLVTFMDVVECVYTSRHRHYLEPASGIPAAALKDPQDSHQREVRGIFVPRQYPIGVIRRTIPDLRQYCERVSEIPDDEATAAGV